MMDPMVKLMLKQTAAVLERCVKAEVEFTDDEVDNVNNASLVVLEVAEAHGVDTSFEE